MQLEVGIGNSARIVGLFCNPPENFEESGVVVDSETTEGIHFSFERSPRTLESDNRSTRNRDRSGPGG